MVAKPLSSTRILSEMVSSICFFTDSIFSPGKGGGTDARYFYEVADDVYRFYPIRMDSTALTRFHGIDEKISKANYRELVEFSYQLIKELN